MVEVRGIDTLCLKTFAMRSLPFFLVLPAWLLAAPEKPFPVIDTHVHLWDTARPSLTWPRPEHTQLYKPFLPGLHEPICLANGVDGVVVILSGQGLEDNQWDLDVTAHNPGLYWGVVGNMSKAIGTCRFRLLFDQLCRDKRYVGYRLSGRYLEGWPEEVLRDLEYTAQKERRVDFLTGSYPLAELDWLAGRIPGLKIMVNHLGGIQLDGGPLDPEWTRDFRNLGKRPNVYCKLSALYGRFEKQPAPKCLDAYRPVIDLAMECFGEDRLVYGSDWPVTTLTGDYASVINLTRAYFEGKDPAVARKVFHDNAVRFYGIGR